MNYNIHTCTQALDINSSNNQLQDKESTYYLSHISTSYTGFVKYFSKVDFPSKS